MSCQLIVHADDFGLSEKVNVGIVDACNHGILRSTSIIASGQAFDHAVELASAHPVLDVGIHLTLIEEQPISAPRKIPSLVTADGRFVDHATTFTKQYLLGKIRQQDIRRELVQQIEKVLASGLTVTHLDSHQHVHTLPVIWSIVCELGERYRIPAIRYPRERIQGYMLKGPNRARLSQQLALNLFCTLANRRKILTTDHFAGFFYGGHINLSNLKTIINHLPSSGSCELMCHPGQYDSACRYNHWSYHWQDELDALKDGSVVELLKQRNIELIGWGQLEARA